MEKTKLREGKSFAQGQSPQGSPLSTGPHHLISSKSCDLDKSQRAQAIALHCPLSLCLSLRLPQSLSLPPLSSPSQFLSLSLSLCLSLPPFFCSNSISVPLPPSLKCSQAGHLVREGAEQIPWRWVGWGDSVLLTWVLSPKAGSQEPGARACLLEAVRHGAGAHRPHDLLKDANSSRRGDGRIWA